MEAFDSNTYTVRQLLKNEIDEKDRGKNYFVPPYQRPYAWEENQVKKLIDDIYEKFLEKDSTGYYPYFIGGIVLSQESILGPERSSKSLEVIDGQQRLTTVILILASIVQLLKFQERKFLEREDASEHLIKDIVELLKTKSLNLETMTVEEKYILERSDNLSSDYKEILDLLMNVKVSSSTFLKEKLKNNDETNNLINIVILILEKIENYDDIELIEFTIQLLNNTWLVVTKTISFDTGIFIFEKLNDSGKLLEPQDLLKNYLFRTSTKEEYDELTKRWNSFLQEVKDINTTKSKILPRDFLDNYLTIIGKNIIPKDGKKNKLFNEYKLLHENSFDVSMDLLDDLIDIAKEYQKIKRDNSWALHINAINFKLGYLIVLAFYKKYPNEYLKNKQVILANVVRLGLVYLIVGQSKNLSTIIPQICNEIALKGTDIQSTLSDINKYINDLLNKKRDIFDEVISSTNVYRKKQLTKLIIKILEFHLSEDKVNSGNIVLAMPQDYYPECKYEGINEDNSLKYANYIGNLLLDINIYNNDDSICFNDRYLQHASSDTLLINDLSKIIYIKNETLALEDNLVYTNWGKNNIIERSQAIAKTALFLIIDDNLDREFFNL
jgi:uncharacterized protein with ParB-like and HNH nuclease domain